MVYSSWSVSSSLVSASGTVFMPGIPPPESRSVRAAGAYMAKRKHGSMTTIIAIAARLVPALFFSRKNIGKPRANAAAKKISCRLVRLNATFVFTFVKSLGTGTYAKKTLLSSVGVKN